MKIDIEQEKEKTATIFDNKMIIECSQLNSEIELK